MATDSVTAPQQTPQKTAPRQRWLISVGILLLGVICFAAAQWIFRENSTFAKMAGLIIVLSNIFLQLLWWTFLSGWSWRVRLTGLGLLAAGLAVLAAVFRLDGADGDMMPRFAYRWSPSRDELAANYFNENAAPVAPAAEEETLPELTITSADWPGFRGAKRDGIVRDLRIRTDWSANPPKELWRHPIGRGWSSFAVVGDLAFTQEQRPQGEAIVCYDLLTGRENWSHFDDARFAVTEAQGGDGPRATPLIEGNRLYALGGTGILNCLDARTGKPVWSRNILEDAGQPGQLAPNIEWGMSGSPWIEGQFVLMNPGGTAGRSVIAYDKDNGKIIWANGQYPASYAGVRVETLQGERVALVFHAKGLSSHALADGREQWMSPWENFAQVNSTQPIVPDEETVLFGSGYGQGTVRLKVQKQGTEWTTETEWKSNRLKQKFNDAILWKEHLYGLDDGILTCLDANTGKVAWKLGRYGYGQILLLAEQELLLVQAEDGAVLLLPATPKRPDEIAKITVLEGICWNHPVLVNGKLLVRNGAEAACFEVGESAAVSATPQEPSPTE